MNGSGGVRAEMNWVAVKARGAALVSVVSFWLLFIALWINASTNSIDSGATLNGTLLGPAPLIVPANGTAWAPLAIGAAFFGVAAGVLNAGLLVVFFLRLGYLIWDYGDFIVFQIGVLCLSLAFLLFSVQSTWRIAQNAANLSMVFGAIMYAAHLFMWAVSMLGYFAAETPAEYAYWLFACVTSLGFLGVSMIITSQGWFVASNTGAVPPAPGLAWFSMAVIPCILAAIYVVTPYTRGWCS